MNIQQDTIQINFLRIRQGSFPNSRSLALSIPCRIIKVKGSVRKRETESIAEAFNVCYGVKLNRHNKQSSVVVVDIKLE